MNGIIIVLGSTNNKEGIISKIGIERLKAGIEIYKKEKDYKFLLTGGFGRHFNITDKPYAEYARNFLLENGISRASILDIVLSSDTVEDAKLSYPIVQKLEPEVTIVVTSEFHMERASFIFKSVFKNYPLIFEASVYQADKGEMDKLMDVERKEIELLKNTGMSSLGNTLY